MKTVCNNAWIFVQFWERAVTMVLETTAFSSQTVLDLCSVWSPPQTFKKYILREPSSCQILIFPSFSPFRLLLFLLFYKSIWHSAVSSQPHWLSIDFSTLLQEQFLKSKGGLVNLAHYISWTNAQEYDIDFPYCFGKHLNAGNRQVSDGFTLEGGTAFFFIATFLSDWVQKYD